jgi:hypothetical protein
MYRATTASVEAQMRDWLRNEVAKGTIEIGLSYHLVFELLQRAEPKYREDRMARARLLTELCGRNAFPYPTDLGQGHRFSKEGLWSPRSDLEDLEIERVVERVLEAIRQLPGLSRHERRVLWTRAYFAKWLGENRVRANQLVLAAWPLGFGDRLSNVVILLDTSRAI